MCTKFYQNQKFYRRYDKKTGLIFFLDMVYVALVAFLVSNGCNFVTLGAAYRKK